MRNLFNNNIHSTVRNMTLEILQMFLCNKHIYKVCCLLFFDFLYTVALDTLNFLATFIKQHSFSSSLSSNLSLMIFISCGRYKGSIPTMSYSSSSCSSLSISNIFSISFGFMVNKFRIGIYYILLPRLSIQWDATRKIFGQ